MSSLEHIHDLVETELEKITTMILMQTGSSENFPEESKNITEYNCRIGSLTFSDSISTYGNCKTINLFKRYAS